MASLRDPAFEDAVTRFAEIVARAQRVLFITGAGLSADSGLPTYRGVGGLYEQKDTDDGMPIELLLSGEMLRARPDLCWKYIAQIELACRGARPNEAHHVIARLQSRLSCVWVLTQNVDGFHRAAGSTRLIEIHGDIHTLRCTACRYSTDVEDYAGVSIPPRCPECGAVVRPAVVLFGEQLPDDAVSTLRRELRRGFDLVVSVGTSSAFPYIVEPVVLARARGAATVEVNPSHTEVSKVVDLHIRARAEPTFDALWSALTSEA